MRQKSMLGARVRLWGGVALALAGSGLGFADGWLWRSDRVSFLAWLGLILAIGVLVWFGLAQAWSGLAESRYLIGVARARVAAVMLIVVSTTQLGLGLGSSLPADDWAEWFLIGPASLQILSVPILLASGTSLIGGPRGLVMRRRQGLGFVRIPWADIDQVVFTAGFQPKTVEIGVALRPGAKPRRSSTRRQDVLLDLPCRVVVPQARFDLPALQRLLAEAGRPDITLAERTGSAEPVVDYPGEAPVNRGGTR